MQDRRKDFYDFFEYDQNKIEKINFNDFLLHHISFYPQKTIFHFRFRQNKEYNHKPICNMIAEMIGLNIQQLRKNDPFQDNKTNFTTYVLRYRIFLNSIIKTKIGFIKNNKGFELTLHDTVSACQIVNDDQWRRFCAKKFGRILSLKHIRYHRCYNNEEN